jgi:hypothetical protein
MDIVNVESKNLVQCQHCMGTGVCARSVEKKTEAGWVRVCDRCGTGIPESYNRAGTALLRTFITLNTGRTEFPNVEPQPPTCRVCGGTGYVRL